MISGYGSFATNKSAYFTRLRAGYMIEPGVYVGPEVLALGDAFFDVVAPAAFPQAILRHRDQRWAARIGLADLTDAEWLDHMARFEPLPGSFPAPLALRYHGHQFRTYNPDLGDGRGFLYAQLHDLADGRVLDLGTKGSGTLVPRRRRPAHAEGGRA